MVISQQQVEIEAKNRQIADLEGEIGYLEELGPDGFPRREAVG